MNQADRILGILEPPPGGWERLHARRNSTNHWTPSWWSFASGAAAAIACLTIAKGHTRIRMQLAGERQVGGRSQGVGVQILGSGRAVLLPTEDAAVRIYWVEPPDSTPAKRQEP